MLAQHVQHDKSRALDKKKKKPGIRAYYEKCLLSPLLLPYYTHLFSALKRLRLPSRVSKPGQMSPSI